MGRAVVRTGTPDSEAGVNNEASGAFDRLYKKAFRLARLRAYQDLKNLMEAEDVAQDVGVLLWKDWQENPKAFEDPEYLRSWVVRKTRGKVSNFLRAKRRERLRDTEFAETLDRAQAAWSEPVHAAQTRVITRAQAEALERLSERRRTCYVMKMTKGMTIEAIAVELHISPSTVEKHIAFASRALDDAERPHLEDLA